MLKNLTGLVHTIGDQVFHFICDPNSPLDTAEEALFQFMNYIRQLKLAAAKAQAEAKAAADQANKESSETENSESTKE